jgi:hypothetical protein
MTQGRQLLHLTRFHLTVQLSSRRTIVHRLRSLDQDDKPSAPKARL